MVECAAAKEEPKMGKLRTHVVTLLDGRQLRGSILKEDPDKIVLRLDPGSPSESKIRLYHQSILSVQDLGWIDVFDSGDRRNVRLLPPST